MCYAWPGPRCSSHAKKRLEKSSLTGDANLIKKAKIDYYLTPQGIKDLKVQGKDKTAEKFSKKRQQMIQQFKDINPTMQIIRQGMQEFEGHEYHSRTINHIKHHVKKYGTPNVGRTRAVFDRGDGYVVKIPINGEGFMANSSEVTTYQSKDAYIPMAKCWHEESYDTSDKGVSTLVMEKVEIVHKGYSELPDWAMSVDCAQVGYTKEGKLVAYDL